MKPGNGKYCYSIQIQTPFTCDSSSPSPMRARILALLLTLWDANSPAATSAAAGIVAAFSGDCAAAMLGVSWTTVATYAIILTNM